MTRYSTLRFGQSLAQTPPPIVPQEGDMAEPCFARPDVGEDAQLDDGVDYFAVQGAAARERLKGASNAA